MLTFAALKETRQRRSVVVAYADDVEVTLYYDPTRFSPNLVRSIEERTDMQSVVTTLASVLSGWNLPDAEPTVENLMQLPVGFLNEVLVAIMNSIRVGDYGAAARRESPGNLAPG